MKSTNVVKNPALICGGAFFSHALVPCDRRMLSSAYAIINFPAYLPTLSGYNNLCLDLLSLTDSEIL